MLTADDLKIYLNKEYLTNVIMVWDASGSVSSVYIARYTIPQLPKGVLTKQTWSLGQCKTQMEMGASPYNSKRNYSQGQVVLAQALSKGNASSYSE